MRLGASLALACRKAYVDGIQLLILNPSDVAVYFASMAWQAVMATIL